MKQYPHFSWYIDFNGYLTTKRILSSDNGAHGESDMAEELIKILRHREPTQKLQTTIELLPEETTGMAKRSNNAYKSMKQWHDKKNHKKFPIAYRWEETIEENEFWPDIIQYTIWLPIRYTIMLYDWAFITQQENQEDTTQRQQKTKKELQSVLTSHVKTKEKSSYINHDVRTIINGHPVNIWC